MGAYQNFFRNRSVGLYPENRHKPSNIGYARITMDQLSLAKRPRKLSGSNSEKTTNSRVTGPDRSDRFPSPVRPVGADLKFLTGQTGCSDRSDRLCPEQSSSPRTRGDFKDYSFKSSPKDLKICREVPGIETNLSTKRINPKRKGSLEFRGGKKQKRVFQKLKKKKLQSEGLVILGSLALGQMVDKQFTESLNSPRESFDPKNHQKRGNQSMNKR